MRDALLLLSGWALCTGSAALGLALITGAPLGAGAEEGWQFLFAGLAGMAVLLTGTAMRHWRGPPRAK